MEYIPYQGSHTGAEIDNLLDKISAFGGLFQKTTAEWNSTPQLRSKKDTIYVYTDYSIVDNQNIPAIKIGDGNAYLIDLPFVAMGVVITQSDIDGWNNKVSTRIDDNNPENLIFYK